MNRRVLLLCAAALAACSHEQSDFGEHVPVVTGTVDLVLGEDNDSAAQFTLVNGLEIDKGGRIVVTDRKRRDVRVFSPDGHFLYPIGRRGQGPGEFEAPCCLTLGPDGNVWVVDAILRRFSIFALDSAGARYVSMRSVIETGGDIMVALDATPHVAILGDTVIGMGSVAGRKPGGPLLAWTSWNAAGMVIRQVPPPPPPPAPPRQTVTAKVNVGGHTSELSTSIAHPFDSRWLFAQARDGTWSVVKTGAKYEVSIFDRSGRELANVGRDVRQEPLDSADLDWAREEIAADMQRSKIPPAALTVPAPEHIPLITAIFFDDDGRLWVQRGSHHGASNSADIYDTAGKLIATARWPGDVALDHGVIQHDHAFGVRQGMGDDGPRVVRLRFAEHRP